ncbi:MAG: hypothetical protein HFF98_01235 [Oscillibacter sp.]|jgi:hypothetical protein|nr:hypothetical protein [Oscillibacter sp.]
MKRQKTAPEGRSFEWAKKLRFRPRQKTRRQEGTGTAAGRRAAPHTPSLFRSMVTYDFSPQPSVPAACGSARYSGDSPNLETVYETSISLLPFIVCTTRIARFQKKSREKITISPGSGCFYLSVSHIIREYILCDIHSFFAAPPG